MPGPREQCPLFSPDNSVHKGVNRIALHAAEYLLAVAVDSGPRLVPQQRIRLGTLPADVMWSEVSQSEDQ